VTVAEVVLALEALGFVAAGATREEVVRVGTARSPILGGTGGERRTLGGRARFAVPGTDLRATVGSRTTFLYCHAAGVRLVEIAHLRTRDVTVAMLRDLLASSGDSTPAHTPRVPSDASEIDLESIQESTNRHES
jgi:hypothetical protein